MDYKMKAGPANNSCMCEGQRKLRRFIQLLAMSITVTDKFLLAKKMHFGIHHGTEICVEAVGCILPKNAVPFSQGEAQGIIKPCRCSLSLHQYDCSPSKSTQRVAIQGVDVCSGSGFVC